MLPRDYAGVSTCSGVVVVIFSSLKHTWQLLIVTFIHLTNFWFDPRDDQCRQGHLIKFSFRLYFCAPGGVIGVKGSKKLQRTWIYWFGALFFSQNWKNVKKPQNPLKNTHFLAFFRSFFNLGWKTAHQTKKFNFIELFRFSWHLLHHTAQCLTTY